MTLRFVQYSREHIEDASLPSVIIINQLEFSGQIGRMIVEKLLLIWFIVKLFVINNTVIDT